MPNEKVAVDYWRSTHSQLRWRLPSRSNVDTNNLLRIFGTHVKQGMRILEIGCAPGKHLAYLAKVRRARVCGLDYSEPGIVFCRELFLRLGLEAEFRCEDSLHTGVAASVFAGRQLLNNSHHPEYSKHVVVLVLVMAASRFQYVGTFLGVSLTAVRTLRRQIPVQVFSLGTTFILSAVQVPYAGLRGAASAVLIVSVLSLAIYATMVWLRVSGRDTGETAVVPLQTL